MTPAEFYVSSDALVHLQISTEYLSKSCRTVAWMPCPTSKSCSRGQSTTDIDIMLNNDFTLTFQKPRELLEFSEQLGLQNKDLFASLVFSIS